MTDRNEIVETRNDVLAGAPVSRGTRVPIRTLFDYLRAGDGIDDFLQDFPSVERTKVFQLLDFSREALVGESGEYPSR
jgi:uncharacterized protein (DUF433 family)